MPKANRIIFDKKLTFAFLDYDGDIKLVNFGIVLKNNSLGMEDGRHVPPMTSAKKNISNFMVTN